MESRIAKNVSILLLSGLSFSSCGREEDSLSTAVPNSPNTAVPNFSFRGSDDTFLPEREDPYTAFLERKEYRNGRNGTPAQATWLTNRFKSTTPPGC